jgi:hypothetical protein
MMTMGAAELPSSSSYKDGNSHGSVWHLNLIATRRREAINDDGGDSGDGAMVTSCSTAVSSFHVSPIS